MAEIKQALVELRKEKERKFNQTVDLIVNLKINSTEEETIKFRISTQGILLDYKDIIINQHIN